jgi:ABC-type transporter Mla subunit MlaD
MQFTPEQHSELLSLDAVCQLKVSEGWKQVLEELVEMEAEAVHDLDRCLSSDPQVSHSLRLRLQAIRAILTRLRSKVENAVRRRNQILQDAKDAAEQAAYEEAQ